MYLQYYGLLLSTTTDVHGCIGGHHIQFNISTHATNDMNWRGNFFQITKHQLKATKLQLTQ